MSNTNKRSWTRSEIEKATKELYDYMPTMVFKILERLSSLSTDTQEECDHPVGSKEDPLICGVCGAHVATKLKSSPTEECVVCLKTKEDHQKRTTDAHTFTTEEDLKDMSRIIQRSVSSPTVPEANPYASANLAYGRDTVQSTQATLPEEIKEITQHDFNARSEEALHSLNSVIRIVNTLAKRGQS